MDRLRTTTRHMRRVVTARAIVASTVIASAGFGLVLDVAACSGEGAGELSPTPSDAGDGDEDASTSDADGRGARPIRENDAETPEPSDAAIAADARADAFDAGACPAPLAQLAPALEGAPPYVATFGPSSRSAGHGANPNPAGRACINCHNPGGTVRPFLFAGTVAHRPLLTVPRDAGPDGGDAGTVRVDAGVVPVQVIVREAQGRLLSVNTDPDGNYFFEAKADAGDCLSAPFRAALRRDSATKVMQGTRTSGNCIPCHSLVAP